VGGAAYGHPTALRYHAGRLAATTRSQRPVRPPKATTGAAAIGRSWQLPRHHASTRLAKQASLVGNASGTRLLHGSGLTFGRHLMSAWHQLQTATGSADRSSRAVTTKDRGAGAAFVRLNRSPQLRLSP